MAAPNDKGVTACDGHPTKNNTNDAAIVADLADGGKAFLSLRATAARRGLGLYRIAGGFLLCWGSTFRELDTLAEVEALLARLEVRP